MEPCKVGVWVDMVVAVMGPGHRHRLVVQLLAGEATRGGRQLLQVPKVSLSREVGDEPFYILVLNTYPAPWGISRGVRGHRGAIGAPVVVR